MLPESEDGEGELEEGGQKVQTLVIRWVSIRDVMYNVMTVTNTAIWYTGKLERVNPKSSHHKEEIVFLFPFFSLLFLLYLYEKMEVLAEPTV